MPLVCRVVVRQRAGGLDRGRPMRRLQKGFGGSGRLVGRNGEIDPAGCTIDGHEQRPPAGVCGKICRRVGK